jgi:hypothetical protein
MSAISKAALEVVSRDGVNVQPAQYCSDDEASAFLRRLPELRNRYKTVEPSSLRREVMGWLDFFEGRARNASRERAALEKRLKDFDARMESEQREVALLLASAKLPDGR